MNNFSEITDVVLFTNGIGNILTKFDVFAQRSVALSWLLFAKAIWKRNGFYFNLGLTNEFFGHIMMGTGYIKLKK